MATVTINGRKQETAQDQSVESLLESAGYKGKRRLIVERNGEPLGNEQLATTTLSDGDRLEVVRLVGGG